MPRRSVFVALLLLTAACAARMVPSFPSLTFPNHYTIVTGLYPEYHGIVSNTMVVPGLGRFGIGDNPAVRDERWWGGEPIWVTAERQHKRAAPLSWPGSKAPVGGVRPTWWRKFDPMQSGAEKVDDVLLPSMGALFVASGPAFRTGVVVPPFQNVHVYDLMAHILGLQPAPNDGSLDSTRAMLRTRAASSP